MIRDTNTRNLVVYPCKTQAVAVTPAEMTEASAASVIGSLFPSPGAKERR